MGNALNPNPLGSAAGNALNTASSSVPSQTTFQNMWAPAMNNSAGSAFSNWVAGAQMGLNPMGSMAGQAVNLWSGPGVLGPGPVKIDAALGNVGLTSQASAVAGNTMASMGSAGLSAPSVYSPGAAMGGTGASMAASASLPSAAVGSGASAGGSGLAAALGAAVGAGVLAAGLAASKESDPSPPVASSASPQIANENSQQAFSRPSNDSPIPTPTAEPDENGLLWALLLNSKAKKESPLLQTRAGNKVTAHGRILAALLDVLLR